MRPATMAQRLAPYRRCYSSHQPTDDHGVRPQVLVVFDGDIPATHFLALAEREMARAGVKVPLWVSNREGHRRPGAAGTRLAERPVIGNPPALPPAQ